jgi:ubiquinone/menaquinone biosynthesis C-methylase UbiE
VSGVSTDASQDEVRYTSARRTHWESMAQTTDRGIGAYYHRRLREIYRAHVPAGQRVLELGCGRGDVLAAVEPAQGLGVDLSGTSVAAARARHPRLSFEVGDAHDLSLSAIEGPFDVVILSDLLNDLWDVQAVFAQVARVSHPGTRVVVNNYSRLWELPLYAASSLRLARPTLHQNWLTVEDVSNLFYLANFEVVKRWSEVLWPFWTPGVDALANRFLVKLWPFNHLALTNFIVARPRPRPRLPVSPAALRVSVVVPARNEAGNIEQIFVRTPEMGAGTELILIEGHSKDDTYQAIEAAIARHPERHAQLFRQEGTGKGDAVRLGFQKATGDVLMILDADLTVAPEDLPRFFDAIRSGDADFVNGVRLVYPMEKEAMRFWNLLGNKFFSLAFSWLLGQSIKDTLCGTKVLSRANYARIAANRAYFGDFDPFGDFDLLFGAARLSLRIVDLPIRYRERTYGTTNIQRWRHGWLLLRMLLFAARRLKFI